MLAPRGENVMQVLKIVGRADRFAWLLQVPVCLFFLAFSVVALAQHPAIKSGTASEIKAFFRATGKTVVTFVGYSGAGYEDERAMLAAAERILDEYEPNRTIVNIGATPDGIGAIYDLAKRKGFATTGIVSTQAKQYNVALSPYVDHVFYVDDATWGGYLKGTEHLSPTSAAMVEASAVIVGIGGGDVARDELLAARRSGKTVRFIPADMNHQKARESAARKGQPPPTDFRGSAQALF
jgi:hypothetical protein